MDKAVLVVRDLANAKQIIEALDRAKLSINVALWAYLDKCEDWRLVLASRRFDEVTLGEAISLVHDALKAAGFTYEDKPSIMILKMSDPTIRDLRKTYAKSKTVAGRQHRQPTALQSLHRRSDRLPHQ